MTLALSSQAHLSSDCWPLADVLYAQVPKAYSATQRASGYAALSLVTWAVQSTTISPWCESNMFVQVGSITSIPNLQSTLLNALNSVTCDGGTLLITLPIVWQVSTSIQSVSIAISTIGVFASILLFAFIVRYRRHIVIRSTAPSFQYLCLTGILLLMAAIQTLARPLPTDGDCSALNWLTQLGFTLLFGPPFMKAYRSVKRHTYPVMLLACRLRSLIIRLCGFSLCSSV